MVDLLTRFTGRHRRMIVAPSAINPAPTAIVFRVLRYSLYLTDSNAHDAAVGHAPTSRQLWPRPWFVPVRPVEVVEVGFDRNSLTSSVAEFVKLIWSRAQTLIVFSLAGRRSRWRERGLSASA